MKAMIMAAGVGSRLMPLTAYIPKPMVPVVNRPLMENTIDQLKKHNFNCLIANLYHQAQTISDYFDDGSSFGVSIQYSREEKLLGTAGGVKNCEWFLDDTFCVISGDALTDIDLSKLLAKHRQKGALATIALKELEKVEQFGVVITDDDGRIKNFQEKPKREEALSNKVNTGVYIFEPEIFNYLPKGKFYDFGKQVFPYLVKIAAPFYGITITDYWCDIGDIDTYRQVQADVLNARIQAPKWGNIRTGTDGQQILLGEGSSIGKNVRLYGNVVLGPGCIIGDNTVVSNSVIWNDSYIGENCTIMGAVLGSCCRIADFVEIDSGAVVASNCTLPSNHKIPHGCKVFYELELIQDEK